MLKSTEVSLLDSCYGNLPEGNPSEKIYKFRMVNGLSREAFAKRIKTHHTAVQNWEAGINEPAERSLKKICAAFGIDISYFEFKD